MATAMDSQREDIESGLGYKDEEGNFPGMSKEYMHGRHPVDSGVTPGVENKGMGCNTGACGRPERGGVTNSSGREGNGNNVVEKTGISWGWILGIAVIALIILFARA